MHVQIALAYATLGANMWILAVTTEITDTSAFRCRWLRYCFTEQTVKKCTYFQKKSWQR